MIARRWMKTLAAAGMLIGHAAGEACGEEPRLLGSRFTPDASVAHGRQRKYGVFLPRLNAGARLYVHLRNVSDEPFDANAAGVMVGAIDANGHAGPFADAQPGGRRGGASCS